MCSLLIQKVIVREALSSADCCLEYVLLEAGYDKVDIYNKDGNQILKALRCWKQVLTLGTLETDTRRLRTRTIRFGTA